MLRRSRTINNFLVALLLLAALFLFHIRLHALIPETGDFILVSLIAAGFFMGLLELVALSALAALLLNWQPTFLSPEMLLLLALPVACWALRRLLGWRLWTSAAILVPSSLMAWYGITAAAASAGHPLQVASALLVDMVVAILMLQFYSYLYETQTI